MFGIGRGFRDELLATALVLVVAISGSYFFLGKLLVDDSRQDPELVLGAIEKAMDEANETDEVVEGENSANTDETEGVVDTTTASPSPEPSPSPSPKQIVNIVEIPVGLPEKIENDFYMMDFSDGRIITSNTRKYAVKIVLANKIIEDGIKNSPVKAVIKKDGKVLTADAPLRISEIATVKPGEQITFSASINLMEGTQVEKLLYRPSSLYPLTEYPVEG